ncbi:hypothetical protein HGRIS_000484 [Hohenbuehelia grisea]|uniref:ABC transmembrane type-1 domain-containing protein n=1 Tax=Hohenbuehelia grisea TaxID=104357 RepID=A0ABR3JR56_9AGAR
MLVLFPVPGKVAQQMQGVQQEQQERMKRTEARVQSVTERTEMMNVFRMIKPFGCERKMSDCMIRVNEKRDAELIFLWKRQILELANGLINYIISLHDGVRFYQARITLARAIYSRADTVLLDDVLAALSQYTLLQTLILGHWAAQYDDHDASEASDVYYLSRYSMLLAACLFGYVVAELSFYSGIVRASRRIHQQLVESALGTTLRWLDTTPTSLVIARCTQDIRAVDGPISQGLMWLMDLTISMLIRFAAVILFTPLFAFPGIFIAFLERWCGQIYIAAQLSVKREMSNAKSPVLGQFRRSYSQSIDALGGMFSASLAAYLFYFTNKNTSNTGFSLNTDLAFSSMILRWVRILNDFEVQGNSGELAVENLSARYSANGAKLLHDISFRIKSGERVGDVGRTGSGKSSLTLTLLRCIYTEGNVQYDGIPTAGWACCPTPNTPLHVFIFHLASILSGPTASDSLNHA